MARLSPEEAAAKWASNTGAAAQNYRDGVMRVREAPGVRAAAQADAYVRGVQESQEKWKRNVARQSLSDWQNAAVEKGGARFAQGVQVAQPRMAEFLRDFLPFQERITEQVRRMPKGGLENGIARMTAQVRETAKYRRGTSR